MGALIKNFEWKLGFNGEYWVPTEVIYDKAAMVTKVTMGLYKNETLFNEVKDEPTMRSNNILARKGAFVFAGTIIEENILLAVHSYIGPTEGLRPGMGGLNTPDDFFSDAVLI